MARIVFIIQREEIDASRCVQPKVFFPIESAFAGAALINLGHQIRVIDLNLKEYGQNIRKILFDTLRNFKPQFVVSAPQMLTFLIKERYEDTAVLFRTAKEYNKDIITIYCGAFATSYPKIALFKAKADYLVRGEFDIALCNIVENISRGIRGIDIPGVVSKTNYQHRSDICVTDNLDVLPTPAYREFAYQKYFDYPGKGNLRFPEYSRKYTCYQTSRGCPCLCRFCNVSFLRGTRKYRVRSLPLVLNDLEGLVVKNKIKEVHFLDENLTLDKNRIIGLCKGLKERNLKFKWIASGGMNVYSLNEEILKLIWESGCYRLTLAFESGSQEVLDKIIKKPVKLIRDTMILKIAKKIGFEIIGYFVVGMPGETREQIKETINFASNPLFDYVTFSIATPQEGTELKNECLEKGLINASVFLADISRRATSLFPVRGLNEYELERIRWKEWDNINFSNQKRKTKIAKITGININQLSKIRENTRLNFIKRWGYDYTAIGKHVGLAALSVSDLKVNMRWMKQPDLRRYLERPEEELTYRKQFVWLKSITNNPNKIALKIIVLKKIPIYIGNVSAFDIDREKKEAELGIFIGSPAYRNRGYGTEALLLFIRYLRENVDQGLKLRVKLLLDNPVAYNTYKKIGFKECKKEYFSFKCSDSVKRIYMVLLPEKQIIL